MANETKKRSRFPVHLSTAIVMMFVAGVLLWANVQERALSFQSGQEAFSFSFIEYFSTRRPYRIFASDQALYNKEYGWPVTAALSLVHASSERSTADIHQNRMLSYSRAVLNLAVALGILFVVWYLSEWWIRRRVKKG
jgi:hypothetical protein